MIRLSEAIRRGCEGTYQIDDYNNRRGGFCAVGAAGYGAGLYERTGATRCSYTTENHFPIMFEKAECPECNYTGQLHQIMSHLNFSGSDGKYTRHHGWTREAIADWIEKEFESGATLVEKVGVEPVLAEEVYT